RNLGAALRSATSDLRSMVTSCSPDFALTRSSVSPPLSSFVSQLRLDSCHRSTLYQATPRDWTWSDHSISARGGVAMPTVPRPLDPGMNVTCTLLGAGGRSGRDGVFVQAQADQISEVSPSTS